MLPSRSAAASFLLVTLGACGGSVDGSSSSPADAGAEDDPRDRPDARVAEADEDCEPPDVLVVLDRTLSMHKTPANTKPANTVAGRATSKWFIAIGAIEGLVGGFDGTIRFGLSMFPRDPGGGVCHTLSEVIGGSGGSNPTCEPGEVVVQPDVATSATDIVALLDPEATLMCKSTPIAAGLSVAADALAALRQPDRQQYIVFIGDGIDSCETADEAIAETQASARAGVNTFTIGFDASGGIDPAFLNDMACAGRTAIGFPSGCVADGAGDYLAADRLGPAIYLQAGDAAGLAAALESTAQQVCCGCVD
jgi:hypothetical protein